MTLLKGVFIMTLNDFIKEICQPYSLFGIISCPEHIKNLEIRNYQGFRSYDLMAYVYSDKFQWDLHYIISSYEKIIADGVQPYLLLTEGPDFISLRLEGRKGQ